MLEQTKKALSDVGRLADEKPENLNGYLAERPTTMPHCLRVWAPCGCCWTYMSTSTSVLTQCEASDHTFDWQEAEQTLKAFLTAEEGEKGASNKPRQELAIVKFAKT